MSYIDPKAEEIFFKRQKELAHRMGAADSPRIFDVGGNVGQSIEAYRDIFPKSFITTFEPQPDCFSELQDHFGGKQGITLEKLALADAAGTRPFYVTHCRAASSLLAPDETVRKKSGKKNYDYDRISVTIDTMDDYCARKNITAIDILKIDVQGAELYVLKGAKNLLTENRIRLIYLEAIFADNYVGQGELSAIMAYLAAFKYLLWDIKPFLFTRSGRLWTANVIFVSGPTCIALEKYPEDFPFPCNSLPDNL
jgi:FkbM family methyltransferase